MFDIRLEGQLVASACSWNGALLRTVRLARAVAQENDTMLVVQPHLAQSVKCPHLKRHTKGCRVWQCQRTGAVYKYEIAERDPK